MADNLALKSDASTTVGTAATDQVTYSGDANVHVGLARLVTITGAEGSKTVGSTGYHVVSAATTNAASVKASSGFIYSIDVFNNAAYPVYLKFHNTAGAPTAGSGVVRTFGIQAGVGRNLVFTAGIPFSTGLGITIVKGIADSDATAVAASDCVVDIEYV